MLRYLYGRIPRRAPNPYCTIVVNIDEHAPAPHCPHTFVSFYQRVQYCTVFLWNDSLDNQNYVMQEQKVWF